MKLIKKVITILMILLITFSVLSDTVKASEPYGTEELKVLSQANGLIKACKKYNIKKIRSYVVKSNYVWHIKDKNIQKYIKKTQKKYFSATVTDIQINGKYAYVYLNVSNFDSASLAYNYLKEYFDKRLKNKSWDYKKNLTPLLIKYYKHYLKNVNDEDIWTDSITLKFKKKNGKWKLAKNTNDLYYMMDGGILVEMRAFIKDPLKYYWS